MVIVVKEPKEAYNVNRDFTSLEAWKKTRGVKTFFYKKVLRNYLLRRNII